MDNKNSKIQPPKLSIGEANFLVPMRLRQMELLDQGVGTLDDVRQNLDEMWYTNKILGGVRAVTGRLYSRLLRNQTQATVVELGTGSGRLGREVSDWAIRHHQDLRLVLVDISSRHLDIAHTNVSNKRNIDLIQADALRLPFKDNKVDYFISSLFLHHFEPDMLIGLLADLYRSVKCNIIMSDLTRSRLSLLGFRFIQPLFARHFLTKHDGLLSIRRAYTPTELLQLAHDAGIETVRVYQDYPWQMTLVAEQSDV